MSTIRHELIYATIHRVTILTDANIHNDIHKQFEFQKQTVLADKILTNDEKTYAIRELTKNYDRDKVMDNDGVRRICENCNQELVLKKFENVENANKRWFEEAKIHLSISNKWAEVVRCYAPEIIIGKEYNFASDIYSIAILMWEISSGQPPFINYEHENEIVMNIINGIRPKIVPATPLEYKNLMKQCWDADPLKRLDAKVLEKKMEKIFLDYHNMSDELFQPEIKEQEAFHSKSYDFSIPNNIDDFNKSIEQNINISSKIINIFKGDSEKLPKEFKRLQINSNSKKNVDIDDDEKEIIQQKIKRRNINDINGRQKILQQ
ncbi:kinase-like domain-containing protein [Rhizophagus clarus]|uniref:Kinase-like domain-containing protein n=1 Tax=Rhizophagus clarus TaxID=94130 RepID=A0A8H3L1N1_9GLOM|nr:kinase-like domain-containing protein [Rhizophagus clarus]